MDAGVTTSQVTNGGSQGAQVTLVKRQDSRRVGRSGKQWGTKLFMRDVRPDVREMERPGG